MLDHSDYEASCAVCGQPAAGECVSNCESARLHISIDKAESQWYEQWREKTRKWVADNAVRFITNTFAIQKQSRLEAHRAYIKGLPNFNTYELYGGRPPLHPHYIAILHKSIRDADIRLRQEIDADWKNCVMKYPEVLAHFYSQVRMEWPSKPDLPGPFPGLIASGGTTPILGPGGAAIMPRFSRTSSGGTIPGMGMGGASTRSVAGTSMVGQGVGISAAAAAGKKARRNSRTLSMSGKPVTFTDAHEDEVMASMLSKMLKDPAAGKDPYSNMKDPYSRPGSKVIDRYAVPQAPEPPPSRNAPSRNARSKRMSQDYSALGMDSAGLGMGMGMGNMGIQRTSTAPPARMGFGYRPEGGRFG